MQIKASGNITGEIRSDVESIAKNPALYEEANFNGRVQAIDHLEFNVVERIEGLLLASSHSAELTGLKQDAERVKTQLEEINAALFRRLRADIRAGACTGTALKGQIDKYVGRASRDGGKREDLGYDNLDVFINGLLLGKPAPQETIDREPEMVNYQPTPARIILELIGKANLTGEDVFYDLGSGLGQVPILVNLLSGARAKGVEFEPAYCAFARACAADLNLALVEFMNADARTADYSGATVFFMYTPFEGRLLHQVLEKLHRESKRRMIRLFTYGPCTATVSRQGWLKRLDRQSANRVYRLGAFNSL